MSQSTISGGNNSTKKSPMTMKKRKKEEKRRLENFSHLFQAYINQIFGDQSVRSIIYSLYGNQSHNKDFRFGLVEFNTGDDEWEKANEDGFVSKKKASYYDDKVDKVKVNDSDDNHHVLYDIKNEKYIDSINTEGFKYQNQERDSEDSLCQTYSLMKFFNKKMDKDPIKKQKQMIAFYRTLLKDKQFIQEIKKEIFYRKPIDQEVWEDEDEDIVSTQKKKDFDDLKEKILDTLDKWDKYGYWYFIKNGTTMNTKYDIKDYFLTET